MLTLGPITGAERMEQDNWPGAEGTMVRSPTRIKRLEWSDKKKKHTHTNKREQGQFGQQMQEVHDREAYELPHFTDDDSKD